jgi:hypothetical protein
LIRGCAFCSLQYVSRQQHTPSLLAECGNQRCEYGENCMGAECSSPCRQDCPFPLLPCPASPSGMTCSGHGTCSPGPGACACFPGYSGATCGECSALHVPIGPHCVALPASDASCLDRVSNGNEEGIDCGGPNCPECGSASAQLWLRPMVLALLGGGLILVLCLVKWWVVRTEMLLLGFLLVVGFINRPHIHE